MQRTIEWLLAIFIFLIPWQARWVIRAGELNGGFWEYGTIAVYATDVLFLIVLLLSGIWWVQQRKNHKSQAPNSKSPPLAGSRQDAGQITNHKFQITKRITYCLLLTAYIASSIIWSSDKLVAVYAVLKLFEGVGLFFLVRHFMSDRTLFIVAFVASAVVQSVLAIVQFLTQSVFSWLWSGIASQSGADLGASVVQFADERWLRAYGSFPHPNILGAFLALALLFTLHQIKFTTYRLLLMASGLLLTTGLFFTFSRAAWLAAIVGIIVWLFATHAWRDRLVRQTLIILTAYVLLLTTIFFPLVRTRIMGGERLEQRSTTERIEGYGEAWQLIKRYPLLGVGIGNYTVAVHHELRPNDPTWSYQPVHNVFVLILAELGLVGFLLLITPFIPLILRGRRESFVVLFPLLPLLLLDHSFWTLHSGVLTLFIFSVLIYSTRSENAILHT